MSQVTRDVLDMSRLEPVANGNGVADKLDDARLVGQGNDSVCAKVQVANMRLAITAEKPIRHVEHLFHDGVLPHLILRFELASDILRQQATHQLHMVLAQRVYNCHNRRTMDTAGSAELAEIAIHSRNIAVLQGKVNGGNDSGDRNLDIAPAYHVQWEG